MRFKVKDIEICNVKLLFLDGWSYIIDNTKSNILAILGWMTLKMQLRCFDHLQHARKPFNNVCNR